MSDFIGPKIATCHRIGNGKTMVCHFVGDGSLIMHASGEWELQGFWWLRRAEIKQAIRAELASEFYFSGVASLVSAFCDRELGAA